jgi:hypothetical protein
LVYIMKIIYQLFSRGAFDSNLPFKIPSVMQHLVRISVSYW